MLGLLGFLGCGLICLVPLTPVFLAIGWANIARLEVHTKWLRINIVRILVPLCILIFISAGILWAVKHSEDFSVPVMWTIVYIYIGVVAGNPVLFFIGLILALSIFLIPAEAVWQRRAFIVLNVLVIALCLLVLVWYPFGEDSVLDIFRRVSVFNPILNLLMSSVFLLASWRLPQMSGRRRSLLIIGSVFVTVVLSISIWIGLVGLLDAMAD